MKHPRETLPQQTGDFPPATEEEWLEKARASLRGGDPLALMEHSEDGIAIPPVLAGARPLPMPARPGPVSKRHGWAIMQRLDDPDLERAAAQAQAELDGGSDGLVLVLEDAPTAGGFGLPVDGFMAILEGLEAELFPLQLDSGPHWPGAASRLLAHYTARRYDLSRAPLLLNAAPFADPDGPEPSARQMAALLKTGPAAGVFCADTRLFHALGASAAQEIALAAAAMVEILRLLEAQGVAAEKATARLTWLLAADAAHFSTMAKLRAARLVHHRILDAAGLPITPLLLQAESAWRMLSRRDAHVNMLRAASAILGAGLGGADAVTVLPFTAALGLADPFARRMARNAQIIALEEAGLDKVADPAAGSAFIEYLTAELARKGWEIFRRIEQAGGMASALASGMVREMLAEMAERRAVEAATLARPITGVSAYPAKEDSPPDVLAPIADDASLPPRLAAPFEALAEAADEWERAHGNRPQVALVTLDDETGAARGRREWAANLLAAGGMAARTMGLEDFHGRHALAILCAGDATLAERGAQAITQMKEKGARQVWIAGKPEVMAQLLAAGAEGAAHAGMDALAFLRRLHEILGVS